MIDTTLAIGVMNDEDLLACTRELVRKSCGVEADLLLQLAEIDERKLYAEQGFPSMHVFCMKELGFSEGAAYNRMGVARAARRLPAILDALRSGAVHLAGLRVLVPHLDEENHERLLAEAAGKSKREIEEMAARLSPKPPVPDSMRKVRGRPADSLFEPLAGAEPASTDRMASPPPEATVPARREERRPVIIPLSDDSYEIQFTARRAVRDKIRQAQDLLRHRVPKGELAVVIETALDALIDKLKRERFAVGRRPRKQSVPAPSVSASRHTLRMQSSEPSTSAPRGVAGSWPRAAEDAAKRAAWNSTTSRALREHTYTQWTQSASFAAAITCTPPTNCTVAPTWTGYAGGSCRRGPPLQGRRDYRRSR